MKTKGEERRNWQGKEKKRIQRRRKRRLEKERGRKKRKFYFNESLAEGWKRQGQTEEIHSRINTRGCDSSFLLLLFPLWSSPLSLSLSLLLSLENSSLSASIVSEVACRAATMSHRFYQKSKHIRLNSVRWTCRRTPFESLSRLDVYVYIREYV